MTFKQLQSLMAVIGENNIVVTPLASVWTLYHKGRIGGMLQRWWTE